MLIALIFQTIAICLGVFIAVWSILSQRKTAKLKETFSILSATFDCKVASTGVDIIRLIKDKNNDETGEKLANVFLASKFTIQEISPDNFHNNLKVSKVRQEKLLLLNYARQLIKYLNLIDHMCLGILSKVYDGELCKQASYNRVVSGWQVAQSFINKIRIDTPQETLYQDFEKIANEWKKNPLRNKKIIKY